MHISLSPQKMHGTSKLPQNSAKGKMAKKI
jgi:hypothetical protein